jgi:hypothetical protein
MQIGQIALPEHPLDGGQLSHHRGVTGVSHGD